VENGLFLHTRIGLENEDTRIRCHIHRWNIQGDELNRASRIDLNGLLGREQRESVCCRLPRFFTKHG
jgi:hypothetical protein